MKAKKYYDGDAIQVGDIVLIAKLLFKGKKPPQFILLNINDLKDYKIAPQAYDYNKFIPRLHKKEGI